MSSRIEEKIANLVTECRTNKVIEELRSLTGHDTAKNAYYVPAWPAQRWGG